MILLSVNRRFELEQRAQIRNAQCDVALAYVRGIEAADNKPILLIETPEEVPSMENIRLALEQNRSLKDDPEIEIDLEKAITVNQSPAKMCSNVKLWAKEKRARIELWPKGHADSPTPDWLVTNKDIQYNWYIVKFSMPVISRDGKSAYFNDSQYLGPEAGGGNALEYKKLPNGTWKLEKLVGRYIS